MLWGCGKITYQELSAASRSGEQAPKTASKKTGTSAFYLQGTEIPHVSGEEDSMLQKGTKPSWHLDISLVRKWTFISTFLCLYSINSFYVFYISMVHTSLWYNLLWALEEEYINHFSLDVKDETQLYTLWLQWWGYMGLGTQLVGKLVPNVSTRWEY